VAHDPTQADTADDRLDAVILAYLQEVDAGRAPDRREWLARHPDLAVALQSFFADHDRAGRLTRQLHADATPPPPGAAAAAPLPPPVGGYRPLRLLGAGGMGRVYEAEDAGGRRVALKLLAPHTADSPTAVERFRQEGKLAGRIAHPRCVFVFKADAEAGQPYIAMELMSGTTLKDLVERDGPLPPAEAVARILDVIDGLAEAHRAGVIHRDVKPANCYVEPDGRVKVGDFGLSRSLTMNVHLTRAGGFVGTPLFASPEQLKGEPLDARTDVYSVAATLYYLLTGRAPFEGCDGATLVARVVSEPALPPRALRPDLAPALEAVVLRGLERQRERRFQDLDTFRAALLPLLPGRLTIAGLGLRLGAYFLDTIPIGVASAVLEMSAPGPDLGQPSLPVYLALMTPAVLYFTLTDGLWGGSLGKRLVRLRVTRAGGCEVPGLWRGLLRTAIYYGLGGLVPRLLLSVLPVGMGVVLRVLCLVLASCLGHLLCLSTMRARNGYRGLHDLASGTRIVQLPDLPEPARSQEPVAALLPVSRAGGVPHRVGPFVIRGGLPSGPGERLLLGEDPALERLVWLRLRRPEAGSLPAARREVARPTRLRWLAAGDWDGWHWDAFVAPAGEPLTDRIARRGPLGWAATRPLLEQLTEELAAAAADGTLPAVLTPEQVWVGSAGRVQLLDGPADDTGTANADGRSLALLRQVAGLALEGASPAGGGERAPRAVVPLHARALLQRLAGEPAQHAVARGRPRANQAPYQRLTELQADLAATRGRPAVVTPVLRALQLALASAFLLVGCMHMLAWGRTAAVTDIVLLDLDVVRARALQHVLEDEPTRQVLLPAWDPSGPDPAVVRDLLDRRQAEDLRDLQTRVRGLGAFGPIYRFHPMVRVHADPTQEVEPLRFELQPGESPRLRVTRPDMPELGSLVFSREGLAGGLRGLNEPRTVAAANGAWGGLLAGTFALSIYPVLWPVWAFAFRGGLSLRLAGLALVRRGGRQALRLQCAWRALVVWLPFAVLLWLVVWADAFYPARPWLCTLLQGPPLLLLAGYLVLALRFPARGPHDWLARTYLVPR
jgi:hypothetical protein